MSEFNVSMSGFILRVVVFLMACVLSLTFSSLAANEKEGSAGRWVFSVFGSTLAGLALGSLVYAIVYSLGFA